MLTPLEERLLGILMILIMFGMGAALTFKDFRISLRHPQGIAVGFASQYLLMPMIGFGLARLLQLTPEQTLGLILVGCMPGGTTSNIFTYFSKGALSLSILMTVCSTLAAIVMVPALLGLYTADLAESFKIPPGNVIAVLFVLLVPTLIGMWLRKFNANTGAVVELLGGILGVAVIVFLIATWVPRNWQLLRETGYKVYLSTILLGLIGASFGYYFARLLRLDTKRARTVALETGIQNGPLAILIVVLSFTGETQQLILIMPVLYSLFIVINSSLLTLWFRRVTTREELARDQAKIEPAAAKA
jgi:BASS family bile acid:Na+ symporter